MADSRNVLDDRAVIGWKPVSSDARHASVRIRCLNPLRELRARGFPVESFDPQRRSAYCAVVYSKRYDESSYREAAALKEQGVRIVFDLCDNHFYNPDDRADLRNASERLRRMMVLADELVASTEELASVIQAELPEPRHITVIGDAVESEIRVGESSVVRRWLRHRRLRRLLRDLGATPTTARLVWFGIHGGPSAEYGMLDLLAVRPILEEIGREHPLSLTVISNSRRKYEDTILPWRIRTHYLEWNPETFLPALRAHSIAIIPVSDNAFTRCKTNNRVALALQAGLAVVADSIPSYQEFAGVCCLDDWGGVRHYLSDPSRALRDVRAGQELIARRWTLAHIADQWQLFFEALPGGASG